MKKLVVGMLALLSFTFIGCSEDDPKDIRDAAIGEYSGTFKAYYLDGGNLIDLDADENVEFAVSKGSNNTLDIEFEGETFEATKITKSSDGFAFDINDGTIDGVSFSGYQGIDLAGSQYDGRFQNDNQRFTYFFQYNFDGITFVIRMQGDL